MMPGESGLSFTLEEIKIKITLLQLVLLTAKSEANRRQN